MAARRIGLPLLKYLRVQVESLPNNQRIGLPFTNVLLRRFSEEVRGTFLDKSEVTDRVISCVKNFQKVDPSKVLLLFLMLIFRLSTVSFFLIIINCWCWEPSFPNLFYLVVLFWKGKMCVLYSMEFSLIINSCVID